MRSDSSAGAMGLPMARPPGGGRRRASPSPRAGRGPIEAAVARVLRTRYPRGVAEASDVIMLCVPNSPEVDEVVGAMLPALGPGRPSSTVHHRPRGGAGPARPGGRDRGRATSTRRCRAGRPRAQGHVTLMVGGDAADAGRHRPALDPFAGLSCTWAAPAWARWSSCATR